MTEIVNEQEFLDKAKRGVRSLVDFRDEFLEKGIIEVPSAKFHYEWSDILLFSTESFAIEGFRESGKTAYVINAFPKYCVFYPSAERNYIVLLKQNATLARDKLREIERGIADNKWLSGKILKVIEESGDAYEIVVRNPETTTGKMRIRIETYGKGSSIRGLEWNNQRPSIVIADDLQDEKDAMSQANLDSDWVWFRSEVGFLGKHTRFFMIANNLGEKCIIEQIASNPSIFGFKFIRIPIIDENGVPAWGDMFPREFIEAEKKRYTDTGDIAIWMRNRMCVAVSPETQVFKKDDLRWYSPQEKAQIMGRCNIFVSCDFAGSGKASADLCAFAVIGVDEDDYWYVLDMRYGKWDSPDQIKKLFELVREYKPYRVGIETVGQHGGLMKQTISKAMTEERCVFTPSYITPSNRLKKEERIEMSLGQRVRLGKLLLPEQASWLDETLTELLMFTREGAKSRHDDCIDALSQAAEFAKAPISKDSTMRKNNTRDLPRNSIYNTVLR